MKRKSKPPVTACYTPAVTNACPVVQTAPAVNTTSSNSTALLIGSACVIVAAIAAVVILQKKKQ